MLARRFERSLAERFQPPPEGSEALAAASARILPMTAVRDRPGIPHSEAGAAESLLTKTDGQAALRFLARRNHWRLIQLAWTEGVDWQAY